MGVGTASSFITALWSCQGLGSEKGCREARPGRVSPVRLRQEKGQRVQGLPALALAGPPSSFHHPPLLERGLRRYVYM